MPIFYCSTLLTIHLFAKEFFFRTFLNRNIQRTPLRFLERNTSKGPKVTPIKVSFFYTASQPLLGQGLHIVEASQPHPDSPHSVGLLWGSDQTAAETSYLPTLKAHKRHIFTTPAGFKPTILANERPQTYSLDRAATGIGIEGKEKKMSSWQSTD